MPTLDLELGTVTFHRVTREVISDPGTLWRDIRGGSNESLDVLRELSSDMRRL